MSHKTVRYLVISREGGTPWVVAETVGEPLGSGCGTDYAAEVAGSSDLILSRDEAVLDPDFADAVGRWDAGDDRLFAEASRRADLDCQMIEVMEKAVCDLYDQLGGPPVPEWRLTWEEIEGHPFSQFSAIFKEQGPAAATGWLKAQLG